MKTINDLNIEEKINLMLYKAFKKEYIGECTLILALSIPTIIMGSFMCLFPVYVVDSWSETSGTLLMMSLIVIAGFATLICGAMLLGLSLYMTDKRNRKLQVAFELETTGSFENIFDISDKDIKHVKRIWQLTNNGKKGSD